MPDLGIDLDRFNELLLAELEVHNAAMQEFLGDYVEYTTEIMDAYGGKADGQMVPATEYSRTQTQAPAFLAGEVAFPLRSFQFAMGWTRKTLNLAKPYDLARRVANAESAHRRRVIYEFQNALYTPTNRTDVDPDKKITLTVRALLNADSQPIPDSPSGNTFTAATHTHYDFAAVLNEAAVTTLVDNVLEHEHGANVTGDELSGLRIIINKADETVFRSLANFKAYEAPTMGQIDSTQTTPAQRVMFSPYNRAIGLWDGFAEVWVKPWTYANYIVAYTVGPTQGGRRPIGFRQRSGATLQGLQRVGNIDAFPLLIDYFEAEFGMGGWERSAAAVSLMGAAAYTAPTITL